MFEITLSRRETMSQDIVSSAKTMFPNIVDIIHYLSPSRKSRLLGTHVADEILNHQSSIRDKGGPRSAPCGRFAARASPSGNPIASRRANPVAAIVHKSQLPQLFTNRKYQSVGETTTWESRHLGGVSGITGRAVAPRPPPGPPCSALIAQGQDGPPFSDWERERRGSPG